MNEKETIETRSGLRLQVERRAPGGEVEIKVSAAKPCLLHWGVRRESEKVWHPPPPSLWPAGTRQNGQAVQTPFARENGHWTLALRLQPSQEWAALEFVLFFPEDHRWDNNAGRNYQIALRRADSSPQQRPGGKSAVEPAAATEPPTAPADKNVRAAELVAEALHAGLGEGEKVFERVFDVEGQWQLGAAVTRHEEHFRVSLLTNVPGPLACHWGIARRSPHEWLLPPESVRGARTVVFQGHTAQTPFVAENDFHRLVFDFPEREAPLGLQFVLRQEADGGRWLKHRGGNFYLPVCSTRRKEAPSAPDGARSEVLDQIIRAETTHNSWTLMHRFNLCHDLLDQAGGNVEALAALYAWLRFSAIRQLTWQRNYNTKPRELAHAQDRLTSRLAEVYRQQPASRPLARLMLSTVGAGGEGQRIRDEILNIMHRHHVKEVTGHFLEEWHQKLHNNTTPDDVVICEAYLDFLRSNGNTERFYQTLAGGGVTRERLESFERPIRSAPDFAAHIKDGLIHDFQSFLKILKASHSGTDFETAVNAARGQLDGDLQGQLDYLFSRRNDPNVPLTEFVSRVTQARSRLSDLLHRSGGLRELLYLDLALEALLRVVVERNIHLRPDTVALANLIACVLENVTLSYEDPELAACCRHWHRLVSGGGAPNAPDWSLHAKSVVDRIARALGAWIDHWYRLLQPKAEALGHGFQAEAWTITLFSEEVVRGSSLGFVLSLLLRHLEPLLRQTARVGNWQIVSRAPGNVSGKVEIVDSLRSIQHSRFEQPAIILTDKVMGDEEIPEGVVAVIAPDVTDIVSHVAVRARNANLLFAACHDTETLERLKSRRDQFLRLGVSPAGDVLVEEAAPVLPARKSRSRLASGLIPARGFTKYAVGPDGFTARLVGAKARHLAELRGQLPDWIQIPASAAVPFGVFEKVLSLPQNKKVVEQLEKAPGPRHGREESVTRSLADLRQAVLSLAAPKELPEALRRALAAAGLPEPKDWDKAWRGLKQVWASKWNDRAWLSRQHMGLPHDRLYMAVLIQRLVPADYAFVLHTVNPANGNANELFGEVVLGLGESLVGNYPGRALSFVFDKRTHQAAVLSYPGKSTGLYGGGLIFRSDSSGEDLPGYAGAGLYDSVPLDPPRHVRLDYTEEPLIWDERFRADLLATISRLGLEVERALGSPQDIEGALTKGSYYLLQTRPQVGDL